MTREPLAVRVPASSANLGAGVDVLGMALDLHLDLGMGAPPADAQSIDQHHPAARAFVAAGGSGSEPIWIRSAIPMGRGLGFSGAARVAGAALGVIAGGDEPESVLAADLDAVLRTAARLEGHGDNAAASVFGGVVAWVDGAALRLRLGPTLAAAAVVAWVPNATTSTDRSRNTLPVHVPRADAVFNLGRVAQFVMAVEHDDPGLLVGATDDRLHQATRVAAVSGAADALEAGVAAGAWCAWLSGSGPTVALLCATSSVESLVEALPLNGHTKVLRIATSGVHVLDPLR